MSTQFWIIVSAIMVLLIAVAAIGPALHLYGDTTDYCEEPEEKKE